MFDQKTYHTEYYRRNKAKLDARAKAWRDSHPDAVKGYSQDFREENRDVIVAKARANRVAHKDEINRKAREYRQLTVRSFMSKQFSRLRRKNRRHNLERYRVDITLDYLLALWEKQEGKCAISGKKLEHKFNSPYTASVDRINSQLPYIEGNVRILCQAVNFAKNSYPNEDFVYFWRHDELPPH